MKKFIIVIIALFYSFLGVQMLFATDTKPNHFKFINQKNVALSSPITSNTITVSGIDAAADISIVGGTYSITDGPYTGTSGKVNNGDTVTVQVMSAASFSTTTTTTLTIGGVKGTFSVKTLAADPKPDKFTFIPQTAVELNTVITSNTITVSGINEMSPISIVGGTYSINSGPYTDVIGTVENGDTVTVQVMSAGIYNKKTTATLTIGGVKGAFSVTTLTFTQADLTGTWHIHALSANSASDKSKWYHATLTFDSSGNLTAAADCLDSFGGTCPDPGSIRWRINGNGVMSETGTSAEIKNHYTMASNKKFMAGTGENKSGSRFDLEIIQKDTGASYSPSDVQNKSFVYHQLKVGGTNEWRYGAGTISADGTMDITSETVPSGSVTPSGSVGTISVDSNGLVAISGVTTFHGFLSDDKKTVVGTETDSSTSYMLIVMHITGQTYTSDALAETWFAHMLTATPKWIHFTAAVASDGVTSFSHWVCSASPCSSGHTTPTFSISSSGTVTIAEDASFHGQMSDDGKFMVTTETMNEENGFALSVFTR